MKKKMMFTLFAFILLFVLSSCTSYPEETRMAKEYLDMTFGEIKALWGSDCILGGDLYDGAEKGVCYADERTPYVFLFEEEPTDLSSLSDDAVVTLVRAESEKGIPCEAITQNRFIREEFESNDIYTNAVTDTNRFDTKHIKAEGVSVTFVFPLNVYDEAVYKSRHDYLVSNNALSSFAYDVFHTPKEYQQKQYYHDTPIEEFGYWQIYETWPNENWDGETEAPLNYIVYKQDHGEWSDPDAVAEFIETGVWPEDAYIPYPYDDMDNIDFRAWFDEWPPENWDHLPIDEFTHYFYNDFRVWPDPDAYTEFRETGHWPEGAYVPYPYNDMELLQYYWEFGEWPEGTDLSQIPDEKW